MMNNEFMFPNTCTRRCLMMDTQFDFLERVDPKISND